MAIDYDRTAAEYEASLVTKLRGHGAGSFLEHWVPDPDPALGIFNMVEAAWTDGRTELEVQVSKKVLTAPALQALERLAAAIADLRVQELPSGYTLGFTRAARAAPKARQAGRATAKQRGASESGNVAQARKVTWDIHPLLRDALEAEAAEIRHEGSVQGEGIRAQGPAEDGSIALLVEPREGMIVKARHEGVHSPIRRKLAELMCRAIEGRTVQDASDHAAIYAVHRLQSRAGSRPAEGIVLPANAGLEVTAALQMVRAACRAYQAAAGAGTSANFFEPGPGAAWKAIEPAHKLEQAVRESETFITLEGLPRNALKPVRVDKDIYGHELRVIVQVNGEIPGERVPSLLRRLERHLKGRLDPALQVYLEPWKDQNVLRRL